MIGVRAALKLLPMVFLRSQEFRQGRWEEIDWTSSMWRIPATRMKGTLADKRKEAPHLVPLSTQAVVILKELHAHTGPSGFMFPGQRSCQRPMSDAAINAALQAMGYDTKNEVTGHGFRSTARTLGEQVLKCNPRVLELQLAHATDEELGNAYDRADFLQERVEFMQQWADLLDRLKNPPAQLVRRAA